MVVPGYTGAMKNCNDGVAAAIVAGGESRRMGRDKASLVLPQGGTLLERTVATAAQVCTTVVVVGRDRPMDWSGHTCLFLPDKKTGIGPLGGLQTALEQAGTAVLLLPCDLPHLTSAAVQWLTDTFQAAAATQPNLAGLAVEQENRIEPLFAIYTQACRPFVNAQIAEERYSLQKLIQTVRQAQPFVLMPAPPYVTAVLFNANTPQEWNQVISSNTDQSPCTNNQR